MNEQDTEELRRVARLLLQMADREPNTDAQAELKFPPPGDVAPQEILTRVASAELECRALRAKFLPQDMFAEGGWNILLDLFVSETVGKKVAIIDACLASGVPTTTALRHLQLLVNRGLVDRVPDRDDRRREHVCLSVMGRETMRATLTALHRAGSVARERGR